MNTKQSLSLMILAGYHQDPKSFTRLYITSKISRQKANEAFWIGEKKREAGMICNCFSCKQN